MVISNINNNDNIMDNNSDVRRYFFHKFENTSYIEPTHVYLVEEYDEINMHVRYIASTYLLSSKISQDEDKSTFKLGIGPPKWIPRTAEELFNL